MKRRVEKKEIPLPIEEKKVVGSGVCTVVFSVNGMSIVDDAGQPVFDGIEYQSTMSKSGANLAVFYPEKFKCTYSKTYEVTELSYTIRGK